MKVNKDILILKIATDDIAAVNYFFDTIGYNTVYHQSSERIIDEEQSDYYHRQINEAKDHAENIGSVAVSAAFIEDIEIAPIITYCATNNISLYVIGKDFTNQRPGLWLEEKVQTIN